ncbi:MAG: biopolymer transporter ExbD [Vicingaceae bacterium]|jgi:biopolymer transport protein ExbD|nr:MAG: biopolymer transporter ExbD [Bacteroidia bacterium]GIV41177.1 MAG: biopolymer transporter ExbD [Vicingaceae bacterium]
MSLRTQSKIKAEFSMASMTDIVFLLLIFFIVISTLITPYGLNVVLPKSKQKTNNPKTVTIVITADGKFFLNGKEFPIETLEEQLKPIMAQKENPGIVLKADEMVPHGFVVKIMDIAARNKYKLVIATSPK